MSIATMEGPLSAGRAGAASPPAGPVGDEETGSGAPWMVGGRDMRLDLLRGLCIAKMIVNHGWKCQFHQAQAFLGSPDAASGFFVISGAVVGLAARKRFESGRGMEVSARLWRRAAMLYVVNFLFLMGFIAMEMGGVLRPHHLGHIWSEPGGWPLALAINHPYFLLVLPRYAIFLALAPAGLWLMARGRTRLLAGLSAGLWGVHFFGRKCLLVPFVEHGSDVFGFHLASWQVLFVAGMILGWHRERASAVFRRFATPAVVGLAVAAQVAYSVLRNGLRLGWIEPSRVVVKLIDRQTLGPVLLLDDLVVLSLSMVLVSWYWRPLHRWAGPFLMPLGQNALRAFLLSIPLTLIPMSLEAGRLGIPLVYLLLNLTILGLIWATLPRAARPVSLAPAEGGGVAASRPRGAGRARHGLASALSQG